MMTAGETNKAETERGGGGSGQGRTIVSDAGAQISKR